MRFRGSSTVGHKAHFNRDEGQERLVKVNAANRQKMKYRLHFGAQSRNAGGKHIKLSQTEQTHSSFTLKQLSLFPSPLLFFFKRFCFLSYEASFKVKVDASILVLTASCATLLSKNGLYFCELKETQSKSQWLQGPVKNMTENNCERGSPKTSKIWLRNTVTETVRNQEKRFSGQELVRLSVYYDLE